MTHLKGKKHPLGLNGRYRKKYPTILDIEKEGTYPVRNDGKLYGRKKRSRSKTRRSGKKKRRGKTKSF